MSMLTTAILFFGMGAAIFQVEELAGSKKGRIMKLVTMAGLIVMLLAKSVLDGWEEAGPVGVLVALVFVTVGIFYAVIRHTIMKEEVAVSK